MSSEFESIKQIARASLMPDFFAVRIEEEGLFKHLQILLSRIQFQPPIASVERIKQIARETSTPGDFVERLKSENLWNRLRDLMSKIKLK